MAKSINQQLELGLTPPHIQAGLLYAGVDEAGRGPLAGPVFAAAVILDPKQAIPGLADSKKISAGLRTKLAEQIKAQALAWAIASASVQEIDKLNILQASLLAMTRACMGLQIEPELVLIDGNHTPKDLPYRAQAVIKGDSLVASIAAASILAKTARDAVCLQLDAEYPLYGFARHKGYATALHLKNLQIHGPCPAHRRSFSPVRLALQARSTYAHG